MLHNVSGQNFHGRYRATFRGPEVPYWLSESQVRKYHDTLCGIAICTCGGGYGEGPDEDSALVMDTDSAAYMADVAHLPSRTADDLYNGGALLLVPAAWYTQHIGTR